VRVSQAIVQAHDLLVGGLPEKGPQDGFVSRNRASMRFSAGEPVVSADRSNDGRSDEDWASATTQGC
jgi:hypothetical protein